MDIKDLKLKTNLALPSSLAEVYSNVDGLSLQNLFYTRFNIFPHCCMFTQDFKGGENFFDTESFLNYLIETVNADEEMEHIVYSVYDMGTHKEKLGFCVALNKSHIFARIEDCVNESYVLYDTEHRDEMYKFVDELGKFYKAPEPEKNNLWTIASTSAGFTLCKRKAREVENFDVNKQYNDSFITEYNKINAFLEEDDKGGLIILHGEKGTGKTTYIRHLINKYSNRKFVFVPSNLINLLGDPSFGTFLQTLANHVIILEDCENAIRDRKSGMGSSAAVSLLLNMTDGLLEDDLGIKFICTFNEDVKNIDPALLRKGRLISKYEFNALDKDKANDLLCELYKDDEDMEEIPHTEKPMTLADIYNIEDDSYEEKRRTII